MFSLISPPDTIRPLSGKLSPGHERRLIKSGTRGTLETLDAMREMVTLGKREGEVRAQLYDIIKDCPPKDYLCYARAAYLFCRDKIRYVFDPSGVELVENPKHILKTRVADCDSICCLLATLCEQMGFQSRFVTIKADLSRPNEFSHVYMQARIPKHGWVSMDATMPNKEFGWEPDPMFPRSYHPASNDAPESHEGDKMAGMGQLGMVPGASATPGVVVSQMWAWQQDGNLFPATPDDADGAIFAEETMPELNGAPVGSLTGMGDVGGVVDQAAAAYSMVTKILSGSLYDSLLQDRENTIKMQKDLLAVESAFNAMPAGAAKNAKQAQVSAARASLKITIKNLNDAFSTYNSLISKINSMGGLIGMSPYKTLPSTGLSAVQLLPAAVIGALGVAGVYGLVALVDAFKGNAVRSKGLIEQAAEGITSISNLTDSLAKAALVGAALYVGLKLFKARSA